MFMDCVYDSCQLEDFLTTKTTKKETQRAQRIPPCSPCKNLLASVVPNEAG